MLWSLGTEIMVKSLTIIGIIEVCLSGILMIFGSLYTIIGLTNASHYSFQNYSLAHMIHDSTVFLPLSLGLFGILAFLIGLIGGIFLIKKKQSIISAIGLGLAVVWYIILLGFVVSANRDGIVLSSNMLSGLILCISLILISIVDFALLLAYRNEPK